MRPAVLIVPEDRLDPGQGHQRVGRQTCLPGLGGELDGLSGGGVGRRDLAAPELELGEQGQGKGQDGRGACRARRADDAVEHRAGVRPLLDPHQQQGGSAEHERELTERVDRLQRPEHRLEQGKGLIDLAAGRGHVGEDHRCGAPAFGSGPGQGTAGHLLGARVIARHEAGERGGCAQSRCTRLVVRLDPVGFGDEHRVRLGHRAGEEHREPAELLKVCPGRRLGGQVEHARPAAPRRAPLRLRATGPAQRPSCAARGLRRPG